MEPMVASSPVLDSAVVTLDVLHSGVVWGWFVTMNLWAKSIATGAVLVGAWAARRHPGATAYYQRWAPIVALVFLSVTLLFTTADLHQPTRFWHMFVYFNPTSVVAWAGWLLGAFEALLAVMVLAGSLGRAAWVERLWTPTLVLAFAATVYTAALLGQANAREVWSAPTEVAQTLLSAALAGAGTWLLAGRPADEQRGLASLFAGSAGLSLVIYGAELVFAPMKSEDARVTMELLGSGALAPLFLPGLALAFGVPLLAWFARGSPLALRVAAAVSIAGLWLVKHAFLLAPQLIPLS